MLDLLNKKSLFVTLLLLFSILSIYSLEKFPTVFYDEAMGLKRAWSHITRQKTVLPEYAKIQTEADVAYPLPVRPKDYINLLLFLRIAMVKLFGVSIAAMRAISLVFGFLVLWLTYLLAKLLYNKRTAALAVIFLAVSLNFWRSSHLARQEIVLIAYMLLSFYLLLQGVRQNKNFLLYLSLIIAILSYGIHQHGFMTPLIVGALFMYLKKDSLFKENFFWGYCAVMGTSLIAFLLFYGKGYSQLLTSHDFHNPLRLYKNFAFVKEFTFYYDEFSHVDWLVLFLWLAVFLYTCQVKKQPSDVCCLIIFASYLTIFTFVIANDHWVYLVTYYPIVMISIASLVDRYAYGKNNLLGQKASLAVVALLFCFYTLQYARRVYLYRDYNYERWMAPIKSVIPANAVIMGMQHHWPALHRHSFYLPFFFKYNQIGFYELMERIKPDIIISDEYFDGYIRGIKERQRILPESRRIQIEKEYRQFMKTRAKKILSVPPARDLLLTEVYKISWDDKDKAGAKTEPH